MDMGLKDKIAVITGGSIGIGLAVAEGLAAEGAVLVDQVRSIDRKERIIRILGDVPAGVLRDVRERLGALLALELPS